MKRWAIWVLCFLGSLLWAETIQQKIETLQENLKSANSPQRAAILNDLGMALLKNSEKAEAKRCLTEALSIYRGLQDQHGQAVILTSLGQFALQEGDYEQAKKQFNLALELGLKLKQNDLVCTVYGHLGGLYNITGQYPKALDVLKKGLVLAESKQNKPMLVRFYQKIGNVLFFVNKEDEALSFFLKGQALSREIGDATGLANSTYAMGNVYRKLKQYNRAHQTFLEALQVYEALGDRFYQSQLLGNLGNMLRSNGDLPEAKKYLYKSYELARQVDNPEAMSFSLNSLAIVKAESGDNKGALDDFKTVLAINQQMGNKLGQVYAIWRLAQCWKNLKEMPRALGLLNEGLVIAESLNHNDLLIDYSMELADQYEIVGDFKSALVFRKRLEQLKERSYEQESDRKLAELEARYNSDQKEKELGLLKRDQLLSALQLASERQRFYIATLAALLFLVGLFWIGKRYRRLFIFWKKKSYIGHYQLGERLGGGGIGDVYKAYSVRDANLPVALKLLREEYARDPLLRKRFLNEAKVIDQLDHPNIVKVLERGETNDRLYLAMEFIDGKTLAQIIKDNPRLPIAFCIEVMKQLLAAVEALHHQGVLHRDLKPDNVMVLGGHITSPQVKLMDFDLARDVRMTPLTQTGELLGTLPYMPPERISGQVCSEAGDLYSLGVLFYEMLTGEKPFPADTPVEVMKQVLDQEPLHAKQMRDEISLELSHLITSLMNKIPGLRPDITQIRILLSV